MFKIRQHRLGEQLREMIAQIIHQELKDPRLGFITITRVDLTSDGSYAKVGYSCLGSETERERSQEALDHAAGFVRSLIRKRLHVKVIPELTFRYDASITDSIEMSRKLDELRDAS